MKKTNLKLLAAMALPVLVLPQQSFAGFWLPSGFPNGRFPTIPMQNQQGIPTPKFIPFPFMTLQPNVPNGNYPMQNQQGMPAPQFDPVPFMPPQSNIPNQQNAPNPQFNFQQQTNSPMQNARSQDKNKIKQEMKPKKAEASFILRRISVLQLHAPTNPTPAVATRPTEFTETNVLRPEMSAQKIRLRPHHYENGIPMYAFEFKNYEQEKSIMYWNMQEGVLTLNGNDIYGVDNNDLLFATLRECFNNGSKLGSAYDSKLIYRFVLGSNIDSYYITGGASELEIAPRTAPIDIASRDYKDIYLEWSIKNGERRHIKLKKIFEVAYPTLARSQELENMYKEELTSPEDYSNLKEIFRDYFEDINFIIDINNNIFYVTIRDLDNISFGPFDLPSNPGSIPEPMSEA